MITFDAPKTDGGTKIDRFQVSVNGGRWTSLTITHRGPLTATVRLSDGRTYRLRVRAHNSTGYSNPSNMVSVTPKA